MKRSPTCLTFAILLAAASTTFAQATSASYDIATFQKEYPPAATKLAEAYSHVRLVGTEVERYSPATGVAEWMRESHEELLYSDGAMQRVSVNLKSTDTRWPPGSTTIVSGTPDLLIDCYRVGPDGGWLLNPPLKRREFPTARMVLGPVFAPYCLSYSTVEELLKVPSRQIVSVALTSIDDKDAIEMITDLYYEVKNEKHLMREHFFFQPHSWALLGRTLERGPLTIRSKVTYDPAGPDGIPRFRSSEGYEEHAATPGKKENYARFDVSSLEFVTTPQEQFQPAALAQFGAKDIADIYAPDTEPAPAANAPSPATLPLAASPQLEPAPSSHATLWTAIIAATLIAAGALLLRLRARRRGS